MLNFRSEVQLGEIVDISAYKNSSHIEEKNQSVSNSVFGDGFNPDNSENAEIPSELNEAAKNKENITKTHYDEYGNFCIQYKDGTIEKYAQDENNKYTIAEKTTRTENGYKTEFYDTFSKELYRENIIDEKNNTLQTLDYAGQDNSENYTIFSKKYNSTKEAPEFLTEINTINKTNGKLTESSFKINRNSKDVISVENTNKFEDGSIEYRRFDGKRAEDKYNAMTTGQFYTGLANEQIKYDKEGNIKEKLVREADETGALTRVAEYDGTGNLVFEDTDFAMDDKIGTSYQGRTGDCYLLASINALAQCPEGQKILKDNITETSDENGKKVYTVELPGAKKASESLKTNLGDDKVFVSGTYKVTQDELDNANLDTQAYSDGDKNVLLYELAFNKYRDEVKQTVMTNNIDSLSTFNIAGLEGFIDPNVPLAGGFSSEADFILTGKSPDIWWGKNQGKFGIELDADTHSATFEKNIKTDNLMYDKKNQENEEANKSENKPKYTSVSKFMKSGNLYKTNAKRDEILNKAIQDSKDGKMDKNAITAGLYVSFGNNIFIPHAVAILQADEEKVTFVDSTDKSIGEKRKYELPIEEFKKVVKNMDIVSFDK